MQIMRLFEIVYLLLEKKKMTSKELAEYFEVSQRTILRDIDTLTMAGIPIYTEKGRGGGISLLDNFVLNKATLTENEQNHILFALKSLVSTRQIETEDISSKLSSFFGKSDTDWIEVDFSRWGQGKSDNIRFQTLKTAILEGRAVEFEYVGTSGNFTSRKVYPLRLVFKHVSWYLQGFCVLRQDYRIFKLSRILGLTLINEGFSRDDYSAPEIEPSDKIPKSIVNLILKFPKHVAYRVYDEFEEGAVSSIDDEALCVEVALPEDDWLYSFLLSFGSSVEVIAPLHVKNILEDKKR